MKKIGLLCLWWMFLNKTQAINHQFSFSVPYQFVDYKINKHTLGIGFQYQFLLKENLAPGILIHYDRGINNAGNAVPLNSIFTIKPTLTYYLKPDFKRFFFNVGFGYALINESKTTLPTSIYIPFKDQFLYSLGAGYNLPIKKIRLGFSTEVGGYFQPNASAPVALFFKSQFIVSYCLH